MTDPTAEAADPRTQRELQYGLLLPHFGSHASRERLVGQAPLIEAYGFDSVWVRDHIVYKPHEHEDPDPTHLDAMMVLAAIAAVTSELRLATGTLVPHRHPIHCAQSLASLDFIAGPGRIIAAFGLGNFDHEFRAVRMADWDRREVLEEQVGILRQLWSGKPVDHHGRFYDFEDVQLKPVPSLEHQIPIWYGGASPAAVRRAVEYCDGWLASRIPLHSFIRRMARMRRLAGEAGKAPPDVGVVPYVSPAATVEQGAKAFDLAPVLTAAQKNYGDPPAGSYQTLDDLDGAVIAGPADVIIEAVRRFQEAGARHVVFDLRARFADWEDALAFLAEHVLTRLHADDGRSTPERGQPDG